MVGKLPGWRQYETLHIGRLIQKLQCSDHESGSLPSSRLSLNDAIPLLQDGRDPHLLDDGWFLVTISVNSSNKFVVELEILKSVAGLLLSLLSLIV